MRTIEQLVRPNILSMIPYSSARDEFNSSEGVFLDANENPYGVLNRYPDPYQRALKTKLSELNNVGLEQIFIGNGSDEVIDLCYRTFCRPGIDRAITFTPTYGMYEVSADINDVELIKVPLNDQFQIEISSLKEYCNDDRVKLLFVCSPNNPTGNLLLNIEDVLKSFDGIVVVDEAYIDFANSKSWVERLKNYNNLIVCQTMSKAKGLAGARVGVAYSSKEVVAILNKLKPPYNVSYLNQNAALRKLENIESYQNEIEKILSERQRVQETIVSEGLAVKVYPSDANFLLVEFQNADAWYKALTDENIITRNRNSVVNNCIRITIGTQKENDQLLTALRSIAKRKLENEESTFYR